MRLSDLEPRWASGHSKVLDPTTTSGERETNEHGRVLGMTFICPVHRTHRLGVWFANPADGGIPARGPIGKPDMPLWQRSGETFETMTLSPSINAGTFYPGCWHGHIANGDIL